MKRVQADQQLERVPIKLFRVPRCKVKAVNEDCMMECSGSQQLRAKSSGQEGNL